MFVDLQWRVKASVVPSFRFEYFIDQARHAERYLSRAQPGKTQYLSCCLEHTEKLNRGLLVFNTRVRLENVNNAACCRAGSMDLSGHDLCDTNVTGIPRHGSEFSTRFS